MFYVRQELPPVMGRHEASSSAAATHLLMWLLLIGQQVRECQHTTHVVGLQRGGNEDLCHSAVALHCCKAHE